MLRYLKLFLNLLKCHWKVQNLGCINSQKLLKPFMLFFQERIRNMTWIKERWWKILETLPDRKVVRQLWSKWSRWWVAIIVILCDHSQQNTTKTQQPKSKFHEKLNRIHEFTNQTISLAYFVYLAKFCWVFKVCITK